jgi:hypothetical protein
MIICLKGGGGLTYLTTITRVDNTAVLQETLLEGKGEAENKSVKLVAICEQFL